jgi:hypothetical protein
VAAGVGCKAANSIAAVGRIIGFTAQKNIFEKYFFKILFRRLERCRRKENAFRSPGPGVNG